MYLRTVFLGALLLSFAWIGVAAEHAREFRGKLSGSQQVPSNNSTGLGFAVAYLSPSGSLRVFGRFSLSSLIGSPTQAHLHMAPYGQPTTTIVLDLTLQTSAEFEGQVNLSEFEVAQVKSGLACVDVHTDVFPNGEIRAQLTAPRPVDYNGDGVSDLSVLRRNLPSEPYTLIDRDSSTGQTHFLGPLGLASVDNPCTADIDGDGLTDHCIYRDGVTAGDQSYFYFVLSADGTFQVRPFGLHGDQPVLGRWDDDTIDDLCVFRKGAAPGQQAYFWLEKSTVGPLSHFAFPFGTTGSGTSSGDLPVPADYDGDGLMDRAVFRFGIPPSNHFIVEQSSDSAIKFSQFGDKPAYFDTLLPRCDFDGDQKADMAVCRRDFNNLRTVWIYKESSTGAIKFIPWGASDVQCVPSDLDGDGLTDPTIRQGTAAFGQTIYWTRSTRTGEIKAIPWGIGIDQIVGQWFLK